ncbi:hypothetical protein PATSB16_32420 [Pandoraea thiooxydans]|nr:hypothetical protein PATSB16_32420 [Pandoraea thiooxydans]
MSGHTRINKNEGARAADSLAFLQTRLPPANHADDGPG